MGRSTCLTEYLAMSEVCQEIISMDKSLRDMLGFSFYPVTIWCDNRSARDCTLKDGTSKLKDFDDSYEEIQRKLRVRETTGVKEPITNVHGDYKKICVKEKRVKVQWIQSKDNLADIMTKPLPTFSHTYRRDKILS